MIGDMTIRQFLYVAVGGLLCYLVYTGGVPFLIRWFLILLIAAFALGMAFLPMEERGLDEWIRNFFLACYSPTQRVWGRLGAGVKRKAKPAEKMEAKPLAPPKTEGKPKEVREEEVRKVAEELKKVAREMGKGVPDERGLSGEAEKISSNLDRILAEIERPKGEVSGRPPREESGLREKVREFSTELEKLKELEGMKGVSPDVKRTVAFYRGKVTKLEERAKLLEEKLAKKKPKEEEVGEGFAGEKEYRKQIEALEGENKALTDKISRTTEEFEKLKTEIRGLSEEKGGYARSLGEKEEELRRLEEERNRAVSSLMRLSSRMEKVKERKALPLEEKPRETKRVIKEEELPKRPPKPISPEELAPITSNIPNTISGVARDSAGKLLPGIMIVVEDEDGDPVRAIKTNKLGQFSISTPLPNGNYTVRVESKERKFSPVRVICDGSVLAPIVFM